MSRVARAHAIALGGLNGTPVTVEAHVSSGLVMMRIVGLADASLKESGDRIRSALASCGIEPLRRRLTINLVPADVPKSGSSFDLAIAMAALAARGLVNSHLPDDCVFGAELGLDASLHPVRGALAIAWAARENGFRRLLVAPDNAAEAAAVPGLSVYSCQNLREVVDAFPLDASPRWDSLVQASANPTVRSNDSVDLAQVRGHPAARRAMLIAAVGGHHVLLQGEAGAGKSLLAARLVTLLPDLSAEDAIARAALCSLAGIEASIDMRPPCEVVNPHTSLVGLVGGGSPRVRPGAASLAHAGVLVLDEAPELPRRVIESLRAPLDTGEVVLRRSRETVRYPAVFQLAMTANPCPCALRQCSCNPRIRSLYQRRLSGPLLDRIDIYHTMSQPSDAALSTDTVMTSHQARDIVSEARLRSAHRWNKWDINRHAHGSALYQDVPEEFVSVLHRGLERGWLSMRGAERIVRLAWSVADLEGHCVPTAEDFAESLDLRTRESWGG